MSDVHNILIKNMKKFRVKQSVAFILCIALMINTFSIDAFAASGAMLSSEEELPDAESITDDGSDLDAPAWESLSGGDAAMEPAEQGTFESVSGEQAAMEPSKQGTSENISGEQAAKEPAKQETLENISGEQAAVEPSKQETFENISGEQATVELPQGSVSMSDAVIMPNKKKAALYAAEERLEFNMTWPSGYNDSSKTLTLSNGRMSFSIFPGLSGSTVNAPILKIQIPSCMSVTYYPDTTNEYLKPYLAAENPVSKTTDGSGNTILTYRFIPNTAWVNFSVDAEIQSGYQIKSGETYSIRLDYYNGSSLLKSAEKTFTTKNPTLETGGITLGSALNARQTLQETPADYDISYSWTIGASSGHYPYTSLKMITPLPAGAVPGFGSGTSFSALQNGVTHTLSSSDGQSYTLTYSGGNLIYEISAGAAFLSSGTSFTFDSPYNRLYLRFANPAAGTYKAAMSPRIECVVDGQTIVMRDHSTSSYLATVTFEELQPWQTVRPYDSWSDIIYLKEGVSVYDTNAYTREIYASPSTHVRYDSLKMTVPLPEGAVPGFGSGDSFVPLSSGTPYENGNFRVTYYANGSYSGSSVSGTANLLVYEISSGSFLNSGSNYFTFSGSKTLRLRFTNPKAGECKSAVSPKIEITRDGQTTTKYDFNKTNYFTMVTFVEPPEESGVYPDFVENDSKGWGDTITIEEGKTVYDTKLYDRTVYSPASLPPHYPYDLVRMTVLLPDDATPGFGCDDSFQPLTNGETYTRASRYGNWKVTYYREYPYSNKEGTVSGTAQALVYELASSYSSASFLKSSSSKTFFTFSGNDASGNLYLRFTNPEFKTYSSAASPKIECVMDGKLYVSAGYFSQTNLDTFVTFEGPKTDWSQLTVSGSTNETPYGFTNIVVLPKEYQNDKAYYGHVKNNTGYTLQDVKISYTFGSYLGVDKLELNLGAAGYPANATITYTTQKDETEKTVSLNTSDNKLVLAAGDTLRTAVITYDSLESSADSKQLLTASLHNYEWKRGTQYIEAIPVSASSELDSSDEKSFASRQPSSNNFYLANTYYTLSASVTSQPKALTKGDEFQVNITTGRTSSTTVGKYQNLKLYFRMPKGYIMTGYEPPSEWKDGSYNVTNRTLFSNGDVLYCLEYTDNVLYGDGIHTFSFRVGPEANTSTSHKLYLPEEVYAAAGDGALFQFQANSTEEDEWWDINGDGDMEDSFFKIPLKSLNTYITINPLGLIAIAGYLSSTGQVGENLNNEYYYNSAGNYSYYLYNGIGSGASVTNAAIRITLHKKGEVFDYKNEEYTSQYDVQLTGPVTPEGSFLEGCTVQYSVTGEDWLDAEQVEDYTQISHVKIQTGQNRILESAKSAYLKFPFSVSFSAYDGTEINWEQYKTYIEVLTEYNLGEDKTPTQDRRMSELSAKLVDFSGTIFQDRNCNGKQDADEIPNDKAYTLKLYSGESTDNEALIQEIDTDSDSGSYSFGILLPGTYTLHVEKGEDEFYGASEYFDENGNYTFSLNDTTPPATKGLNMGILVPSSIIKPDFSVYPDEPDGKDGWYVTLPQISLRPMMSSPYVNTMFWHDNETAQKLTAEVQPSVEGSGNFSFSAYNEIIWENRPDTVTSDTAALNLKVDVDKPIVKDLTYSTADGTAPSACGSFLPFGNFFGRPLQITVIAEDAGSGLGRLYYTLPGDGEEVRSVTPEEDGFFRFDIPMHTTGRITYHVEDKAGNTSEEMTLQKADGSDWWVIEDESPVWENFVLTDINGNSGVRGADGGIWFTEAVTVSARVTDEDSGLSLISYSINEGATQTQKSADDEKLTAFDFTATIETEGANILRTEAKDNAANTSDTRTALGIDRTAPIIVLEEKSLTNDAPTATVLIKDTGSGVDPDSIQVLWMGEETEPLITPCEDGYKLTFPITELNRSRNEDAYLVTARDYVGRSTELSVTRYQREIIYVAAFTGSDETGDGCIVHPLQTLKAALERVAPGGMIVLLEDYTGTAYVNMEVTLDLNGQKLQADVSGSAVTVGSLGILTIKDSNGSMSMLSANSKSEGEVFGGIPGDPAFTLEEGTLYLTDGTIYCGYVGSGSVEVMEDARMMYLLTYLSEDSTGENPGLHYIEANTEDELKPITFIRKGYDFQGWLYEDHLYNPGQKVLMPAKNMQAVAKWSITEDEPEPEARGNLDQVPKTGRGRTNHGETVRTDLLEAERIELYIKTRKKEDEQSTEH
ncbi:MAG: hypothetical protein NC094_05335 [Bacteroidales bacterium]|nr:hypothetical protein [Lachnoclostridium sp.]MCM1384159.1 hypothetical protein [Lachnoclostridium sp.]MCM1464825.1 hypothetical protein [Bacteroidales bacterium]